MLCNSSLAGVCDLLDTRLAFWLRPGALELGLSVTPSLVFKSSFHSCARSGPLLYATNPHFFIQSPSQCITISSVAPNPLFAAASFSPPRSVKSARRPCGAWHCLCRCNLRLERMGKITVKTMPSYISMD